MQDKVQHFISETVKERWDKTQKALLLSDLGADLKRKFPNVSEIIPMGIKEYLREWPVVQKIEYPGIAEKIGLVPNDVKLPDDVTPLFFAKRSQERIDKGPVFKNEFWRAFITPIDDRRFIIVDSNETFIVSAEKLEDDANQAYEITKADLPSVPEGAAITAKAQETYKRIDEWIIRHGLQKELFLKHRRQNIKRSAEGRLILLSEIFGELSENDQSRISIPLDILIKMISRT